MQAWESVPGKFDKPTGSAPSRVKEEALDDRHDASSTNWSNKGGPFVPLKEAHDDRCDASPAAADEHNDGSTSTNSSNKGGPAVADIVPDDRNGPPPSPTSPAGQVDATPNTANEEEDVPMQDDELPDLDDPMDDDIGAEEQEEMDVAQAIANSLDQIAEDVPIGAASASSHPVPQQGIISFSQISEAQLNYMGLYLSEDKEKMMEQFIINEDASHKSNIHFER